MKLSLAEAEIAPIFEELQAANSAFGKTYPGDSAARQPVHTVYGGAHLFKADSAKRIGSVALRSLEEYAPDAVVLAQVLGLRGAEMLPGDQQAITALQGEMARNAEALRARNKAAWLAFTLYERVVTKLQNEPVEDFRLDFEDGYGNRVDDEEDGHAVVAAGEVARGFREKVLPPFIGIRLKPFTDELKRRSVRTLDIFLSTLLAQSGGRLPNNFVVTLPKVTVPEQVSALVKTFQALEKKAGLSPASLKLELMIETPQAILNSRGESAMPAFVAAANGRCVAAHFGVYDYTASCNITAQHQSMDHAACDFARHTMTVALAGTGVWLSDGATNVMPVGPHRTVAGGPALSEAHKRENRSVVHDVWKLCYGHIAHSLKNGFYQGWDLHPAQLPIRYAAVYNFFLDGFEPASLRLKNFVEKAAQATLVGAVFDDAATGQGLLNFFLRGLNCGAITEAEALGTGLTLEEIRGKSFVKILKGRRTSKDGE